MSAKEKSTGTSALYSSVEKDDYEQCRTLLCAGADVEAPSKSGTTPLKRAVYKNKGRFVDLLLEFGADPWKKDVHGEFPLVYAFTNANTKICRTLLSHMLRVRQFTPEESRRTGYRALAECIRYDSGKHAHVSSNVTHFALSLVFGTPFGESDTFLKFNGQIVRTPDEIVSMAEKDRLSASTLTIHKKFGPNAHL